MPHSAWVDGKLAELDMHIGRMVDLHRLKPTQLSDQIAHPVSVKLMLAEGTMTD